MTRDPIWVTLTSSELLSAGSIGLARHAKSIKRGQPDCHGYGGDSGWSLHIEGACGELAAAKASGRYWPATIDSFKNGDDVSGFQVRTRSKHEWDLIIRDDDKDDRIFVLVTGQAPRYAVRGWIRARDGKKDEHVREHGSRPSAWFVPQVALLPMETLPPKD